MRYPPQQSWEEGGGGEHRHVLVRSSGCRVQGAGCRVQGSPTRQDPVWCGGSPTKRARHVLGGGACLLIRNHNHGRAPTRPGWS